MGANNETGFAKTIAILAGIATIVGVVIAILNWLMPFSPVGSSPLAPSPIASITTYLNSPDVNATISGFVIAFFAEPVKIYFQNRAKLNDLRVALYKKLLANYVSLYFLIQDKSPLSGSKKANYYRMPLRRECYEHALENEISLFYRLNESSHINVLQGSTLYRLVEISSYIKNLPDEERSEVESLAFDGFISSSKTFLDILADCFQKRLFDPQLLKKLTQKQQYHEIMTRKVE